MRHLDVFSADRRDQLNVLPYGSEEGCNPLNAHEQPLLARTWLQTRRRFYALEHRAGSLWNEVIVTARRLDAPGRIHDRPD